MPSSGFAEVVRTGGGHVVADAGEVAGACPKRFRTRNPRRYAGTGG